MSLQDASSAVCRLPRASPEADLRSKLEQLEQELQSIKQVVNPSANGHAAWTPPSPRATFSALPEQPPAPAPAPAVGLRPPPAQVPTPRSEPPTGAAPGPAPPGPERRAKTGPAQSRVLGSHVVSGEDIDWYFSKCVVRLRSR